MLKLNLSPVRSDDEQPPINWESPVLTIGDDTYDLSELPDGATATHPVLGRVAREGDDYTATLRLTHGPNAPEETRFPEPVSVTNNGPVELPPYDAPEPEDPADELAE